MIGAALLGHPVLLQSPELNDDSRDRADAADNVLRNSSQVCPLVSEDSPQSLEHGLRSFKQPSLQ